jgi:23S rRNA pseudouridine1911/1915/1917 synthase
MKFIVEQENERLDAYLASQLNESRSQVKVLIKGEKVCVNSHVITKPAYILKESDEIECEYVADSTESKEIEPLKPLEPYDYPLEILFEDEHIAVINKPLGIVTHPGIKNEQQTLVHILLHHIKALSDLNGHDRLGIVHRLDKDTEGVMVIAKTNEAHEHLAKQFENREVEKKYYAVVRGNMINDHRTIEFPIGRHPSKRIKMTVITDPDCKSRSATTVVTVVKRYRTKTLCDVEIKTGRTHQIRVHLAYIQHPIIGDSLYGEVKKSNTKGLLLQSYYLSFKHPKTKKQMTFDLPISSRLDGDQEKISLEKEHA